MAALSSEFHAYLQELEKIKNWDKLPHDDPRIVELQRLSNATKKNEKVTSTRKKVIVKQPGEPDRMFDSAADAAEAVKMQPHMLRQVARGERKPPKGLEIKYVGESGEEVIG